MKGNENQLIKCKIKTRCYQKTNDPYFATKSTIIFPITSIAFLLLNTNFLSYVKVRANQM